MNRTASSVAVSVSGEIDKKWYATMRNVIRVKTQWSELFYSCGEVNRNEVNNVLIGRHNTCCDMKYEVWNNKYVHQCTLMVCYVMLYSTIM